MNTQTKNLLSFFLSIILIIVSNIIGHFIAPFSIFASPFLLTTIIAIVNLPLYKSNFALTIIFNFCLLLFNDLLIRYYAGGTHDQVGKAIISILFSTTFFFAIIAMIVHSFTTTENKKIATKRKFILIKILSILVYSILTGLIYYYEISDP